MKNSQPINPIANEVVAMFESLWIEFQIKIVPFLPHLFSFALIILPVTFLAMVNNQAEEKMSAKQKAGLKRN